MIFRDDFENMTEEEIEQQEKILYIIHGAMNREKTMTYTPDAPKRIKSVLYIVVELPIIGGNPRTHWQFQRVISEVDALEIKWLPTGNFRMEFRLNGVFTELR